MSNKGVYKVSQQQVLEIEKYCKETGVPRNKRIKELGLSESAYYRCKLYMEQEATKGGQWLSLTSGGMATSQGTSKKRIKKTVDQPEPMTMELRSVTGTEMRLSGSFTVEMLLAIITHV